MGQTSGGSGGSSIRVPSLEPGMVGRIWEWLSQTPSAMSPILSRFSSSSSTFQILAASVERRRLAPDQAAVAVKVVEIVPVLRGVPVPDYEVGFLRPPGLAPEVIRRVQVRVVRGPLPRRVIPLSAADLRGGGERGQGQGGRHRERDRRPYAVHRLSSSRVKVGTVSRRRGALLRESSDDAEAEIGTETADRIRSVERDAVRRSHDHRPVLDRRPADDSVLTQIRPWEA